MAVIWTSAVVTGARAIRSGTRSSIVSVWNQWIVPGRIVPVWIIPVWAIPVCVVPVWILQMTLYDAFLVSVNTHPLYTFVNPHNHQYTLMYKAFFLFGTRAWGRIAESVLHASCR